MKIFVKAKPNSKENKIEEMILQGNLFYGQKIKFDYSFIIKVKEKPVQGKANDTIVDMIAGYFRISKSSVKILSGANSKNKIFEIVV